MICIQHIIFFGEIMPWYIQSLLISVSMSMDAFAVSLSNGLTAKKMPVKYMIFTALSFGLFQGVMPLIGYLCGSIFEEWIEVAVPIIGFVILLLLGIKMIVDTALEIRKERKAKECESTDYCPTCLDEEDKPYKFSLKTLLVEPAQFTAGKVAIPSSQVSVLVSSSQSSIWVEASITAAGPLAVPCP